MSQKTMYPGIDNSPKTTLSDSISASKTDIAVENGSVFPEGPNLATIGTGDTAEVITYMSVADNTLGGCVRGVGGAARMWPGGTNVYRAYTNYDHQTFIDNITDLADSKLNKTGDAQNATVTFTAATQKANVATGDKLSVILGKLSKWYSSFGNAAWKNIGMTSDTVAAGAHASQHKANGADAITPADIGAAIPAAQVSATLLSANWSGSTPPYSQTVAIAGLGATQHGEAGIAQNASAAQRLAAASGMIGISGQAAGQLIFVADGEKPNTDIPIVVTKLG